MLGGYHLFLASEGFPLNQAGTIGGKGPLRFCLGVGKLTGFTCNPSWDQFRSLQTQHHVILAEKGGRPPDMSRICLWEYADVTAFREPLPCSPKRGPVVFNTLIRPDKAHYPEHQWPISSPSYPGQAAPTGQDEQVQTTLRLSSAYPHLALSPPSPPFPPSPPLRRVKTSRTGVRHRRLRWSVHSGQQRRTCSSSWPVLNLRYLKWQLMRTIWSRSCWHFCQCGFLSNTKVPI